MMQRYNFFFKLPPPELTSSRVEHLDVQHLFCRQFKVEDVEVLLHPLQMGGLRDDIDALLSSQRSPT